MGVEFGVEIRRAVLEVNPCSCFALVLNTSVINLSHLRKGVKVSAQTPGHGPRC